jgi:hypothetical protein
VQLGNNLVDYIFSHQDSGVRIYKRKEFQVLRTPVAQRTFARGGEHTNTLDLAAAVLLPTDLLPNSP